MTTSAMLRAGAIATPRGARVAAALFVRLLGWTVGKPARRPLTRAEEAAKVREMGFRVQATDPGFAADLFAAADRHADTQ